MPDFRQTVLIALPMLMPLAVGGQEYADKVLYKVTYAADYFTSFGQKDVMVLDVGERSSHFYSATEKRKKEILDSLNRHGSVSIQEAMRLTSDCSNGLSFHIYKDFPEKGKLTFMDEATPDDIYKYEEDKPDTIKWKMIEADTTISEYKCQKAEGWLRGRKWTVWFTPDIPVADGPWKLCGLPGLILKATDSEGYFAFDCIGIEQGKGERMIFADKKYVKCTPQQYQKIYYERTSDPIGYIKKQSGLDLSGHVATKYGADALKKKKVHLIEYYGKTPR